MINYINTRHWKKAHYYDRFIYMLLYQMSVECKTLFGFERKIIISQALLAEATGLSIPTLARRLPLMRKKKMISYDRINGCQSEILVLDLVL